MATNPEIQSQLRKSRWADVKHFAQLFALVGGCVGIVVGPLVWFAGLQTQAMARVEHKELDEEIKALRKKLEGCALKEDAAQLRDDIKTLRGRVWRLQQGGVP